MASVKLRRTLLGISAECNDCRWHYDEDSDKASRRAQAHARSRRHMVVLVSEWTYKPVEESPNAG